MSQVDVCGVDVTHPGVPPVKALVGVDLVVEEAQVLAVLGPSGCGKTTLLRVLAGFQRPDAGSVAIGGTVVDDARLHLPPDKRSVGLVPQEGALFPHIDVAANVGFGLTRWPRPERHARIGEMLELVGLGSLARRRPHELSGGQQQRVALARALAARPALVLLDEPFSALDTGLRAELRDDVMTTLRSTGATALLVTHDQTEALTVADRVAVMRDGAVVQHARPSDVYDDPVDAWTARFVGDANLLAGIADGTTVHTAIGTLHLTRPSLGAVTVLVRPEALSVDPDGAATIERIEFHGPGTRYTLRVDDCVVAAWVPGPPRVSLGQTVRLRHHGEPVIAWNGAYPSPPP